MAQEDGEGGRRRVLPSRKERRGQPCKSLAPHLTPSSPSFNFSTTRGRGGKAKSSPSVVTQVGAVWRRTLPRLHRRQLAGRTGEKRRRRRQREGRDEEKTTRYV
ncbi:hypothetical protein E2562_000551 [Oryza meyeriana var. granulata]|uniref:Uncharacterized protein n=1 Tax=Oryza meyeriana var. granulata TaxID=110450 RepID=A0A6G1DTF3_9ORYZ|nr:hypothetical protein E2562_000551 [Oryza meyeriana var. granulata]